MFPKVFWTKGSALVYLPKAPHQGEGLGGPTLVWTYVFTCFSVVDSFGVTHVRV